MSEVQLTSGQWNFLTNMCAGLSQVVIASIAIPYFLDEPAPRLALLGLAVALVFAGFGFVAARKAQI